MKKTAYRLFSIQADANFSTIIDTNIQMRAFEKALEIGVIPWLENCKCIKRNIRLGKSVIDYLVKCNKREIYLEVKSAIMKKGIFAMYPDAPSNRGRRHIVALKDALDNGKDAMIVFISSLQNVEAFTPNKEIDQKLYELLKTCLLYTSPSPRD